MTYYVVDIDGRGFVFNRLTDAASFMRDAVEHIKRGRYMSHDADISMYPANIDKLHRLFPEEYPIDEQEAADETTTCTDADQTEE